jgi:hypothetical protein
VENASEAVNAAAITQKPPPWVIRQPTAGRATAVYAIETSQIAGTSSTMTPQTYQVQRKILASIIGMID